MIAKYSEFKDSLNENIQQAKTYMKNRAIKLKRVALSEEGETDEETLKKVGLSPMEVREAEQNREFIKIKDLVKDAPGYTYVFTKFYFEDMADLEPQQRMEDLITLYNTLKDLRQSLSSLPMPVDRYTTQKPTAEDPRGPYERLIDDLEKLKGSRLTNKWIGELLTWQKPWFDRMTPVQKEKIDGIAIAFDEFGKTPDGKKDPAVNKVLQEIFWKKVGRYKTLSELISGAESNIRAVNNAAMSKFLIAMSKVNDKYGEINGVEEIYNENNILIIEVRSYVANRELNANTAHCIKDSQSQWNHYVGDDKFTKQYYIYNFNLDASDNKSVIGVTVGERGRVTACHLKNDAGFSDRIEPYMKSIKVPMSVLAPMSSEEIEKKKKRMIANKEIVKPKLTLDQVKKYFEEGADPNAQTGIPLQNAVKEDDYDRVKYLLTVGAYPNVGNAIKFAKNLDMIKLLVDYGSEINNEVFHSILKDYDAVEYVLKAGVDPNFEKGLAIRTAARLGDTKMIELLIKYGANVSERRYMVVKWAVEHANLDVIKFLMEKMRQFSDPNFKDKEMREKLINDWIHWCQSSDKITEKQKEETKDLLATFK